MNITLTSVKTNEALSDETLCFSAVVCVDGKPAFNAMNRGSGGSNIYTVIGEESNWQESHRLIAEAEQWAREYLKENFEPLDLLIAQLLDRQEITRILKSGMKTKIMMLEGRELTEIRLPKGRKLSHEIIEATTKRYKNAVVLNNLPLEQAVELVLEASA